MPMSPLERVSRNAVPPLDAAFATDLAVTCLAEALEELHPGLKAKALDRLNGMQSELKRVDGGATPSRDSIFARARSIIE